MFPLNNLARKGLKKTIFSAGQIKLYYCVTLSKVVSISAWQMKDFLLFVELFNVFF